LVQPEAMFPIAVGAIADESGCCLWLKFLRRDPLPNWQAHRPLARDSARLGSRSKLISRTQPFCFSDVKLRA
jgi:hypothetical protein